MTRRLVSLLAVCVSAGVGACSERLDSGAACPSLCPAQSIAIRDTILSPVLVFDSTFVGYPARGQESSILLSTRGDTLETRGVVRFDSLVVVYSGGGTAQPITKVDSSRVRMVLDRTKSTIPAQVRFEVYDVDDTTAADTSAAAVLTLFRANRRIGQLTVLRDSLTDTLFVPLSDSAVLNKVTNNVHLRLGIRVDGSGPVSLHLGTVETGNSALLYYHPTTTDTTVRTIVVSPISSSPAGTQSPEIRTDLQDFMLVAKYAVPQTTNTMSVGGVPGRRVYLRFNVPRYLTDSTTVIRASLRLTQRPLEFGVAGDTMILNAHVVLAGPLVTDLRQATSIIAAPGLQVLDSLVVSPRDSGVRIFEMFGLLRAWGAQATLVNAPPHSVVLRSVLEGVSSAEIRFFSTNAPAAVRPTMVISYIPKTRFGIP